MKQDEIREEHYRELREKSRDRRIRSEGWQQAHDQLCGYGHECRLHAHANPFK